MDELENKYEQERLKTIADNQALLASLGLNDVTSSRAASSRASSSGPASKRKAAGDTKGDRTKKKPKVTVAPPARTSMRLRGMLAQTEEDAAAVAEYNAEEEKARAVERRLARKVRKPTMELAEMIDDDKYGGTKKVEALGTLFHGLSLKTYPRETLTPREDQTDPDDQSPASAAIEASDLALRQHYGKVRFIDEIKASTDRAYSLIVHPEKTKCLSIMGDKRGMLAIWDAEGPIQDVTDEDGQTISGSPISNVWRVQAHQASAVSCLRWNPVDAQTLYTASYDCSLRRFDLATSTSTEVLASPDPDALFNHFDLTPDGNQIWLVDSEGGMNHMDMREGKRVRRRFEIAEGQAAAGRKVGGFSINPVNPWLVCSAHNDRTMRIWDLRNFDKLRMEPYAYTQDTSLPGDLVPPHDQENYPTKDCDWGIIEKYEEKKNNPKVLRARAKHGLSCSSAYWDLEGKRILTTSYDDRIRVWNAQPSKFIVDSPAVELKEIWAAKHDTQVGRWVTVFKAQWSPYTDLAPHVMVGNMKRRITILSGLSGKSIVDLSHGDITAVPAVHAMHPGRPGTVLGANASGKIMMFAIPGDRMR